MLFVSRRKLRKWLVSCAAKHDYTRFDCNSYQKGIERGAAEVVAYILKQADMKHISYEEIDRYNWEEWK